jgi:hypothetical protein
MSAALRDAFQRELMRLREFARGDIVRGTASFRCGEVHCPVGVVRVGFEESRGETKPMQNPLRCPRCNGEMNYVGLEKVR